ncbi:MAG: DUF4147 domain-containing protein, partial [Rhodospirillales bacterium]|nr:DUF4147 domain-containing protein [Rhodospirillales bacterium]
DQLLRSGATIGEINCLRKHISLAKGGRLAAACRPARLATLLISDVVGDSPSVIASGPTVPDPSTLADALRILKRRRIDAPASVISALENAANETPKPGDPAFEGDQVTIIADAGKALAAASEWAQAAGVAPHILGLGLEGEAKDMAKELAAHLGEFGERPVVLLSGGEATVTVTGGGAGGPNGEFLLALALELQGAKGVFAIACDTDGIDGSQDNAGAYITPDTLARAKAIGIDAGDYLGRNDSYGFFNSLGDLIVTGPTYTNVNDFRAILLV